jgi:hypothetical protein
VQKETEMKKLGTALFLLCAVSTPSAIALDVPNPNYTHAYRPPILYFAGAEKGPPATEFYRMDNPQNVFQKTEHSRNGNTAPGPTGGQHSYLFLAVEGYATGRPGINSDGREGAMAYANLTDASATMPNTIMVYGFSVYLPSALYTYGANYPTWIADHPVYDDRVFKLTSTTLPWVPVLEISANRGTFNLTYRGGNFTITGFSEAATSRPSFCEQGPKYQHTRVTMGSATANVWHDFVVQYKASISGSNGRVEVWHRTPGQPWVAWLSRIGLPAPNEIPTSFSEASNAIAPGVIAAWGYERPSHCYAYGDVTPSCKNDCDLEQSSPKQPNGGLYIDNIVLGSTESAVKAAFPPTDTGF